MQNLTKPTKEGNSGSGVSPLSSLSSLSDYLNGVQEELKKAIWPTRQELIKMTQIVLFLIVAVALYCGALDALLTWVMHFLLNTKPTG